MTAAKKALKEKAGQGNAKVVGLKYTQYRKIHFVCS